MKTIQALGTCFYSQVLKLNAEAQPAVTLLDRAELSRLNRLSDAHLIVVDSTDAVLGYALAFYHDATYDGEEFQALKRLVAAPFLYIDQVVIAATDRGTGQGRSLYNQLAAAANRDGIHVLCCDVNTTPPNTASLAFHSRLGFERIGSLATTDGRSVALLKKTL
jgi:hypothetical protein